MTTVPTAAQQTEALYAAGEVALLGIAEARKLLPRWRLGQPALVPRIALLHLALDEAREQIVFALQGQPVRRQHRVVGIDDEGAVEVVLDGMQAS